MQAIFNWQTAIRNDGRSVLTTEHHVYGLNNGHTGTLVAELSLLDAMWFVRCYAVGPNMEEMLFSKLGQFVEQFDAQCCAMRALVEEGARISQK